MLITTAPLRAASTSAAITLELVRSLFSRIRRQSEPAPAIPAPLSVAAQARPPTWVPWPTSSPGPGCRTVEVARNRDLAGELGVGRVDPRVDDADQRARPPAEVPGRGKALAVQVPLVGLPPGVGVRLGHRRVARHKSWLVAVLPLHGDHARIALEPRRQRGDRLSGGGAHGQDADLGHRRAPRAAGRGGRSPPGPGRAPRPSLPARAGRAARARGPWSLLRPGPESRWPPAPAAPRTRDRSFIYRRVGTRLEVSIGSGAAAPNDRQFSCSVRGLLRRLARPAAALSEGVPRPYVPRAARRSGRRRHDPDVD